MTFWTLKLSLTLAELAKIIHFKYSSLSVLPRSLSEQPPTCPTHQWFPAGSPWWFCPAAPHPAAGERL